MATQFEGLGWEVVPFDEPAHLVVVNSCTVTERADTEAKRILRRARLSNPDARLLVTGCYAQVAPDEVKNAMVAVGGPAGYVFGNDAKGNLAERVSQLPAPEETLVSVTELDKSRIVAGGDRANLGRTRASLKIQDGCDFKCTYCIIWEARGSSRSLSVSDIKTQLSRLVAEDFKEIVLTGINIGQYVCPETGAELAGLLRELITIEGEFRLRLSSLDPVEVTDDLIATVAASQGKLCPYFHLSAQSAEDYVLRRMARRHHAADLERVCAAITQAMPTAAISMDIIVGFPGETAERFEESYQRLSALPISFLHVFSFSKRKGTPAASFDQQIPEREKKARAARLRRLSEEKHAAYMQPLQGTTQPVLIETVDEDGIAQGLTPHYIRVSMPATGLQPNTVCPVRLGTVQSDGTVLGELRAVANA